MDIRRTDIRAIVTAVEWLLEGELRRISIRRGGATVFAAHVDETGLVIDPSVMSPQLAEHLLEHTSVFDGETSSNERETSGNPNRNADRSIEEDARARAPA